MSKAFTGQTHDPEEAADAVSPDDDATALPPGTKNYMTPRGYRLLQEERKHLAEVERPRIVDIVSWAAGNGDRSENGDYIYGKRRLREIDRRLRFLIKRLESAEVVDPARQVNRRQVFFGATVRVAYEDGTERTIRIVGIDEADLARGEVSWVSPIARALLKAREGDVVTLRTPAGPEPIEVTKITYQEADAAAGEGRG